MSFRQSLFFRFGLLGLGAVVMFAAGYFLFGVQPAILSIAEGQFDASAQQVETTFQQIFTPAENLIGIAGQWTRVPGFNVDRPADFNRFFQPILQCSSQITSVVVGSSSGEGLLLLQLPGDKWLNRLTDIPRWGLEQRFVEWRNGQVTQTEIKRLDYDPRRRPWFRGAATQEEVYWTPPYALFTTREPGISVSKSQRLADGRTFVIGFDIKLIDLSRSTSTVRVGGDGFVLVLTQDGRVLGLPRLPNAGAPDRWADAILQPVENLGSPAIGAGVKRWRDAGKPAGAVLRFQSAGGAWLATFRPFVLGTQTFWVAAFAPERDFMPSWQPMVQVLLVCALIVLGLTLLVAGFQARQLSAPLEYLVSSSQHIAHLDFYLKAMPATRYKEFQQVAQAQDLMCSMLRDFRDTVKAQEQNLKRALNEQEAILDNALVGICLIKQGRFIHHNCRAAELFGYAGESLAGLATDVIYPDQELCQSTRARIIEAFRQGGSFVDEVCLMRRDGSRIWAYLYGRAINPESPDDGSVWIVADLTEQKAVKDRLHYLGYHDPLTGLPNRHLFHDRLEHAILHAQREKERLALLFIDLDRFKSVNDTMGHQVGDKLLCAVSERLQRALRNSDTLARMGGDEFIVLIESVGEDTAIATIAAKLVETFSAPLIVDGRQLFISVSLGICVFPNDGHDARTLLQNVDTAMYQAKAQGRNTYYFYSQEMTARAVARLETEAMLRHALLHGGLEIHFQPQVNLEDGSLVGVETLVRLRHSQKGLVPPLEFISIAEETGLIHELGQWVLRESCAAWCALRRQGISLPRVAVNISAKQLQRKDFPEHVREIVAASGMPPGVLELEITESAFLEKADTLESLRQLGGMGVVLALDDFGTGYSSLSYLQRLPFGRLKVDKSFVQGTGVAKDGETLVRTIIRLAATLGLGVVAEGVETQQQMDFLRKEGCPVGQGYLFAKPLPLQDFCAWVRNRSTSTGRQG